MSVSQPLRTTASIAGFARWVFPVAVLLAAVLLPPHPTQAVIERIYTLPFYSTSYVSPEGCCGCYPGHVGRDYQLGVLGVGGEIVVAAAGGTAKNDCGLSPTAGYYIVLDHGNGHHTRYLHLNSPPLPSNGSNVVRGQVIGYEGDTGDVVPVGTDQLHFETRHGATQLTCGKAIPADGTPVDPYDANTYMWETNPPGYAEFAPGVTSWAFNRLDVFVRGNNNGAYHRFWNGSAWSGWSNAGGCLRGGPAAASWGTNRLDIVARGCDPDSLGIWRNYSTNGGASWIGWTEIHPSACMLAPPALTTWGTNRLDLFIRGCDNALWWSYSTNGGSNWTSMVSLGGCLSTAPGAASWGANRIDVFVAGCTDGNVFHNFYNGTSWWGFTENLGGCTTLAPAVTAWSVNRLEVSVRGCVDGLHWNSWNGSSWSGYAGLGGCLTSGPGAESLAVNFHDAFVRGCDNPPGLWREYYNGSSWSGFAYSAAWP